MAEVIVNIKANTGQATDSVDDLNNSLNQTTESADELSASLSKQEARIKTLDGAINLIGGSVEILAGGLALSGALTEEQAEQFQTAAIGAIAFADGTKRVLDGYKSLNEGLAAFGGVAKAARAAQAALNKAVLANPYVAAAVAIAAVTTAVFAIIKAQDKEAENLEKLKKIREDYNKSLDATEQFELQLLKAKRASNVELAKESVRLAKDAADRASRLFVQAQAENRFSQATTDARNASIAADRALVLAEQELTNAIADEQATRTENAKKAAEDRQQIREKELAIALKDYKTFQDDINRASKEAIETFIANLGGITQTQGAVLKQLPMESKAVTTEITADAQDVYYAAWNNLNEFFESSQAASIDATLNTASTLARTLSSVQDESSEEAFNNAKKYKIAEVVTSSIQAAFQAFGAAQQFGPILGPILGAAQVAAIAVASNKAIGDIRSSTFNDTSAPAGGTPNVSVPTNINTGPQGMGQFLPFTAPQQQPPVRAYVVTGDVTNGQVAEAQLQTRRRFG